jgi:tetratricopeptide (TPR) repeat protein
LTKMSGRFAENPAYVEYERLLKELHGVIAQGKGDSDEADAIREAMEAPERGLNRMEITRLNGLSADLYMLSGQEELEQPVPPTLTAEELREQIEEYERWNDWEAVLGLLRRRPKSAPEPAVAFNRARAYHALGHFDTALKFFEHFAVIRKDNEDARSLHLMFLRDAGRDTEALKRAEEYTSSPTASPNDFISAAIITYGLIPPGDHEGLRHVLDLLSAGISKVGPARPTLISSIVVAYLLAAQCLALLGRTDDAVSALDEALSFRPGDVSLREARDMLSNSAQSGLAEALNRAVANARLDLLSNEGRTATHARQVWSKAA